MIVLYKTELNSEEIRSVDVNYIERMKTGLYVEVENYKIGNGGIMGKLLTKALIPWKLVVEVPKNV